MGEFKEGWKIKGKTVEKVLLTLKISGNALSISYISRNAQVSTISLKKLLPELALMNKISIIKTSSGEKYLYNKNLITPSQQFEEKKEDKHSQYSSGGTKQTDKKQQNIAERSASDIVDTHLPADTFKSEEDEK